MIATDDKQTTVNLPQVPFIMTMTEVLSYIKSATQSTMSHLEMHDTRISNRLYSELALVLWGANKALATADKRYLLKHQGLLASFVTEISKVDFFIKVNNLDELAGCVFSFDYPHFASILENSN